MKKKTTLWLGRCNYSSCEDYILYKKKPKNKPDCGKDNGASVDICASTVGELGIKLKRGGLAKVTIQKDY